MAIRDIFKRKKKDEFLDLGAVEPGAYGPATGGFPQSQPAPGGFPSAPMEFPQYPLPQAPAAPMAPAGTAELENIRQQLESLNYKLDTLKAVLDTLNSRIANIENALKVTPFERQGNF